MSGREQQREIDWTRARQLAILRDCRLPAVRVADGSGRTKLVPATSLKLLLRTLDDHGRVCFAAAATLAAETGMSVSSVRRCLDGLEQLGVVCVERRGTGQGRRTVNHVWIVWSELALTAEPRRSDQVSLAPDQLSPAQDQVSPERDQLSPVQHQVSPGGHLSVLNVLNATTTETEDWAVVADILGSLGIRNAWQSCHAAKSHGIRVARAHQLISQWQTLRDPHADPQAVDRELGVLVWALRSATPRQLEEDPHRCFPTAFVASAAARAAAERRRLEAAARTQATRHAESRQVEQFAAIETRWGPVYDAASIAQRLAWVSDQPFLAERLRRDPQSPIVRTAVLAALSRQAAAAAGSVATLPAAAQGVGS